MKRILLLGYFVLGTLACHYDEPLIKNSDVIQSLTFEKPSIDADGSTRTKVYVELPANADPGKRTVELTTTAGTFAETDKKNVVSTVAEQIETGNNTIRLMAQATLVSTTTAGDLTVTARVAGYVRSEPYAFTTAYPETITITPEKLTLKPGFDNEVKLAITLGRKVGVPSLGRTVQLTMTDETKRPVGRLREQVLASDATGKCYGTYSVGDDATTKQLTIQAVTDKLAPATETIYIVR